MPGPTPAIAAQELLVQLNHLRFSQEPLGELAARRVRLEIQKVKNSDPALGFALMGMLACIEWKPEEVKENFRCAFAISISREDIADDYSSALVDVGFLNEAGDTAELNFERFPDNPKILHSALDKLAGCLRFSKAMNVLDRISTLCIRCDKDLARAVTVFGQLFRLKNIDETKLKPLIDTVGAFLRSKKLRAWPFEIGLKGYGTDQRLPLIMSLYVPRHRSNPVDLSFEFAEYAAAQGIDLCDDVVLIRFLPSEEGSGDDPSKGLPQ